jgi:hypothetical protein
MRDSQQRRPDRYLSANEYDIRGKDAAKLIDRVITRKHPSAPWDKLLWLSMRK